MTRVCIIGDSHAAALKKGWRQISDSFPSVELTFFASAQDKMPNLDVRDLMLVPATPELHSAFLRSSGRDAIEANFDAYILCGLGLLLTYAYAEWTRAGTCEGLCETMIEQLRESPSTRTLAKLRSITRSPICVIATPFRGIPCARQTGVPNRQKLGRSPLLSIKHAST
jgi:hypothetical protein